MTFCISAFAAKQVNAVIVITIHIVSIEILTTTILVCCGYIEKIKM